jgi:3-isopropylmalate dehydrogenase
MPGRPLITDGSSAATRNGHQWSARLFAQPPRLHSGPFPIGVLEGEGVGAEIIRAALEVLAALEAVGPYRFKIDVSTEPIGTAAEARSGRALSERVIDFFRDTFAGGGAVLTGPGGGRFVYDLRQRFDLFCKLSPLRPCQELAAAGRLRPEHTRDVDVLVVRENASGEYLGRWQDERGVDGGRRVEHTFWYTEAEVLRLLRVAAGLAADRRGSMLTVVKDGGMPALSSLWRECAIAAAAEAGIACRFANVDLAAYMLVQQARELDVVVAPNLFGDVLADVGGILLGSRALTFSGNFGADGAAVYQTNHGGALDLAGSDRANPAGQISALAMLLRQSFGLVEAAGAIEAAMRRVWRQQWRTADLAEPGYRVIGTREMGARIAAATAELAPAMTPSANGGPAR